MNLVSLLILPAIIALSDIDEENLIVSSPEPAGYAIAGVSLAVLIGAVVYSKRSTESEIEPHVPERDLAAQWPQRCVADPAAR